MTQQITRSLNDEIAEATSEREIQALLAKGASEQYRHATQRTRNRWQRTAQRRRLELKGAVK